MARFVAQIGRGRRSPGGERFGALILERRKRRQAKTLGLFSLQAPAVNQDDIESAALKHLSVDAKIDAVMLGHEKAPAIERQLSDLLSVHTVLRKSGGADIRDLHEIGMTREDNRLDAHQVILD